MNRRIALAAVVTMVVVLTVSAWLYLFSSLQTQITELQAHNSELQNQNNDLKNQTVALSDQNRQLQDRVSQLLEQLRICYNASVRIINSEFVSGFNPFVGLTLINRVNVYSEAAITVDEPVEETTPEPTAAPATAADLYLLPGIGDIIAAIAVVGAIVVLMLRKK